MCKSHKHASNGDAIRIPWPALRQFPTSGGTRVSRHDAGLWEGDDDIEAAGGYGPLAPGGRDIRRSGRKDTRRWCKGKPGREHVPEIIFEPFSWHRKTCGWGPSWASRKRWCCDHRERCRNCGKILRDRWTLGRDCPDYPAEVAA